MASLIPQKQTEHVTKATGIVLYTKHFEDPRIMLLFTRERKDFTITMAGSKIYLTGCDKRLLKTYLLQIPVVYTPGISARWRLRQGDLDFEASVGYTIRCCLENQNETKIPGPCICYASTLPVILPSPLPQYLNFYKAKDEVTEVLIEGSPLPQSRCHNRAVHNSKAAVFHIQHRLFSSCKL